MKAKEVRQAVGQEADARRAAKAGVIFNVSTLLQEPIGSVRVHQVDATLLVIDEEPLTVSGSMRLLRTDGSVLVEAELEAVVVAVCDRCLRELSLPLTLALREEYWPPVDPRRHEVVEVPEGREGFAVVEGHIDLREAIRQYVVMERPMRTDCGAGCPGRPLGEESRSDSAPDERRDAESVDSRWAALRGLRDELDRAGSEE